MSNIVGLSQSSVNILEIMAYEKKKNSVFKKKKKD